MKHMLLARTLTTCALMAALAACTILTAGCGGGHPDDADADADADADLQPVAVHLCVLADSHCGSTGMVVRNHEAGLRTWRVTGSACWATSNASARVADVMTAARNTPACGATARSQAIEIKTGDTL